MYNTLNSVFKKMEILYTFFFLLKFQTYLSKVYVLIKFIFITVSYGSDQYIHKTNKNDRTLCETLI